MSDVTICEFGCSSVDGCVGHCEAPDPAEAAPASGFAADVLWETAAYGPDIKLSHAVRVF